VSGTEAIARRLASAETLQSVVTTMKTLASVRIGQYRRSVAAARAADETIELALRAALVLYPELVPTRAPEPGPLALLVFGSDRGLCGAFNERVTRQAAALAATPTGGESPVVLAVGRRAQSRLRARGVRIDAVVPVPGNLESIDVAVMRVLDHVDAWRDQARFERLVLVHARPVSGTEYTPDAVQLLPFDVAWLRALRDRPWPSRRLPMPILDPERLLRGIVRQYLAQALVRAFAASLASENVARLVAMEAAERNVDERLANLRTAYRAARQNAITEELLDIQSAYAASTPER
jgi:F-type H+-transporting ATPase subunit gamma